MTFKPLEIDLDKEIKNHFLESKVSSFFYPVLKYTLGTLIRLIWVKEVTGLENIPKHGPVIVASNHSSYFDFLCFISVAPRKIHYLAAEKFFSSTVWRPLMIATSQIKVDRISHEKNQAHVKVLSALKQQRVIGIFPEGTRSHNGEIQRPFSGVAKYAVATGSPIIPVGVRNAHLVMARHHKFPRFRKIITLHIGKPIVVQPKEYSEEDYMKLTHDVMLEVARLAEKEYMHHLQQ